MPVYKMLGEDINVDYSHDEMEIYGSHTPDLVLQAHTAEEISKVVALCNENRIHIKSGATPLNSGTFQSFHRHIYNFCPLW